MEVVVTTGAGGAKLQSNHHHQQTNTSFFTGRMPFQSPNQQHHDSFIQINCQCSTRRTSRLDCDRRSGEELLLRLPRLDFDDVTDIAAGDFGGLYIHPLSATMSNYRHHRKFRRLTISNRLEQESQLSPTNRATQLCNQGRKSWKLGVLTALKIYRRGQNTFSPTKNVAFFH